MAQSVDPILLDSTGQDIVTALNAIANKTVDSALSPTSVNPVQNKVITGEINGIKEKIPSDASSSNKMATANDITGVQNAVKANTKLIKDTVGWSGKNIADDSKSEIGIVWNGNTNSARARLIVPCKSNTKYTISISGTNGLDFIGYLPSPTIIPTEPSIIGINSFPVTFTTGASDVYIIMGFNKNNITLNDVQLLKLMLRDAAILDPTYEPYFGSTAFPRSEQAVLGAKNLLDNKATTQTVNGVTYTVNSDGSITANGTATANADLIINQGFQIAEKCILSGCPANGSGSTYRLMYTSWGTPAVEYADTGDGIEINNIPIGTSPNVRVVFRVSNGQTVNNITIKPMVRLASDTDNTFAPHAMTNKELTEQKLDKALTVVSGVSFNTLTETGFYACNGNMTDNPGFNYGWLEVYNNGPGAVKQIFYPIDNADIILSRRLNATWSSWYKFTGTAVS